MHHIPKSAVALLFALSAHVYSADLTLPEDWPQFRGRQASGVAVGPSPPTVWDVESGRNVLWKTEIPGLGHASPIVSRGHLFVVTATNGNDDLRIGLYGDIAPVNDSSKHEWKLLCLSVETGQVFWTRTLHKGVPAIQRHTKASHANSTPATDGKHVIVCLGSEGLYCYDFFGHEIWRRDLGVLDSGYFRVPSAQWGFASSPVIHNDMVILQADVQKDSFLAAYSIKTGEEIWKTARTDVPSWSSPTVVNDGERDVVVVNGFRNSGGYDGNTGEAIWNLAGGGDIPVPTPIFAHGNVYLSSAHGGKSPLRAIRKDARGELATAPTQADDAIAWWNLREGIYQGTPLIYESNIYACRGNGVLSCFDAHTGKRRYRFRLSTGNSGFTASAVAADGHIFFPSESGVISVVRAGDGFELVAENEMNGICMATPAIANGTLFVRTKNRLYAIGAAVEHSRVTNGTEPGRSITHAGSQSPTTGLPEAASAIPLRAPARVLSTNLLRPCCYCRCRRDALFRW